MNVASLENCKELYELSGWMMEIGDKGWLNTMTDNPTIGVMNQQFTAGWCPAYDLGYLLRKLPRTHSDGEGLVLFPGKYTGTWYCGYEAKGMFGEADTPEDAACKLCIELFKQGILQKEPQTTSSKGEDNE